MNNQVFAVDPGRHLFKAMNADGRKLDFEPIVTRYQEQDFDVNLNNQNFRVKWEKLNHKGEAYETEEYFVGKVARITDGTALKNTQDGKGHEATAVMVLTAIHQLGGWGAVKVGIAVPLDTYKSDKEELSRLLTGRHAVTVNGLRRELAFAQGSVFCFPEGMASYYALPEEEVEGKKVHIINIGSQKSHIMTFDEEMEYIPAESGSVKNHAWEKKKGAAEERAEMLALDFKRLTDAKKWNQVYKNRFDQEVEKRFFLTGGAAEVSIHAFAAHFPGIKTLPDPLYSDCEGLRQLAIERFSGE
jgi:hypothetical protein